MRCLYYAGFCKAGFDCTLFVPFWLARVGGIPLYNSYGYVPPQRVWIWGLFGLKTGIDFAHFGLE